MDVPFSASQTPPQPKLILQQKWEDMAKYLYEAVLRHMPRFDRQTLGMEMVGLVWKTEADIVRFSLRQGDELALLGEIDAAAKVMLRMASAAAGIKALPFRKYEVLAPMLEEVGRIVGGLLRKRRAAGIWP